MRTFLAIIGIACFAELAGAHGGVWRPAPGTPGPGAPGVVTPIIPGAPTTGGGGVRPTTGAAGPRVGGGMTFRRRTPATPSFDRWDLWWNHNRESYLPRHTVAQTMQSGMTGLKGDPGDKDTHLLPLLSSDARALVLPALAAALEDRSADVVDSAAIAIARSTPAEEGGPFIPRLTALLQHAERTPREAAILGLGILGAPGPADTLRAILRDTTAGRRAVGVGGPIDPLQRGLAALSLGLMDDADSVAPLTALVRNPEVAREIAACCVLSLGLHRKQARDVVMAMRELLQQDKLDREVRAQIPVALQRLPHHESRALLPRILELLLDDKEANEVRRSAAIALGSLGRSADREVLDGLMRAMKRDNDVMVRNFACVALGRIGEQSGVDPADPSTARNLSDVAFELIKELRLRSRESLRPFSGLALGLLMRGPNTDALLHDRLGGNVGDAVASRVVETFLEQRDPGERGAYAIALGLLGHHHAAPRIREALERSKLQPLRGQYATSLALLGDRSSIPLLREILTAQATDPALRMDVARALGMLRDVEFQDGLIELLREAGNLPEASAAARGLGLVGDRRAAEPLLRLVQSPKEQDLRRAFAIVALGLLAEKTTLPWNTPYAVDANYTLPLRPLAEVMDIL